MNLLLINLSASRITHFRAALRRFFTMLYLHKEIERNPAKNMLLVKRRKSTRYKYIPPEVIISMINATTQTNERETNLRNYRIRRDKLMILLLWCLGLRSGELRAIKKEDTKIIDIEKKPRYYTFMAKAQKSGPC